MIIKQRQLETKYGIKGKTAVHRQAWKEAYVGLVNRDMLRRKLQMTQYERMEKGLLYDPGDPEIMNEQVPFQNRQWEFNQLKPSDYEKKQQYMHEVFAECGENCYIELPLRANWGGHHLHLGSGIYANASSVQM